MQNSYTTKYDDDAILRTKYLKICQRNNRHNIRRGEQRLVNDILMKFQLNVDKITTHECLCALI